MYVLISNSYLIILTVLVITKYLMEWKKIHEKVYFMPSLDNVEIFFFSRKYIYRFARLAAAAFLNNGIPVYLLGKIVPTPFVPFTVLQYGAAAGVMVTASHNPKEDNGYKVYWENGAQVS